MKSTIRINKKEYHILLNSLSDMLDKLTEKMGSSSDEVTYDALAILYVATDKLYQKVERLEVK